MNIQTPSTLPILQLTHTSNEPVRDWSLGPISGHRTLVVVYLVTFTWGLYAIQDMLWPNPAGPTTWIDTMWSWGSVLWLGAVIPGTLGLLGELSFKHPVGLDDEVPIDTMVTWRIVSRGENREVLLSTVRRIQYEMAKNTLFPYDIEVVVDSVDFLVPLPNDDVHIIRVPDDYQTPNNTKFKARGLHYAVKNSTISENTWIIHLDEETQPTSSGVKGICRFIREQEETGEHRIGQGAILYHREWKQHPFMTLADNVRTGDDFARFHFQHRLGVTVFGLHGSYIVARNSVEQELDGFDFGPRGQTTEDAWWAMLAMEKGHRCAWVEGYLEEQSCQGILDFAKQRARWWQGLAQVAIHAPVKMRWRFCLGVNTILWMLAPFAMFYTLTHFFWGFEVNPIIRAGANYSFATFLILYLIGLKANMDEHGITSRLQRTKWWLIQVVCLPIFSLMESFSVVWGIGKFIRGDVDFHVIKK